MNIFTSYSFGCWVGLQHEGMQFRQVVGVPVPSRVVGVPVPSRVVGVPVPSRVVGVPVPSRAA